MKLNKSTLLTILSIITLNCTKKMDKIIISNPPIVSTPKNEMDYWLTKSDQSILLQKQATTLAFSTENNAFPTIDVDSTQIFQTIDGFGFTLTGGSAYVINRLSSVEKAKLLNELFSKNETAISYLRISIGASDLNETTFTYDDVPQGETDENLTKFSLNTDKQDVIPLLKEILSINPSIKILATPWSPPAWMKDNNSLKGGSLTPQYKP